jgi:hypothetical protein
MPTRYAVPTPLTPPPGFVAHVFERSWDVPMPRDAVWAWLNDTKTFTSGQPWPWFVEFVDGGFEPGVLNTHTGPGIHFCGVIGEVREPEYRDLVYLYGAHVFTMRWIRPTRLQFWLEEPEPGRTIVRLRVDSVCRRWIAGLWTFGNRMFWRLFGPTIRSGARRKLRTATAT